MSEDLPSAPPEPAEHLSLSYEPLDNRIPFALRSQALLATSFASGLILGMAHTSRMAALRFRAENSHRFPTTTRGWYFYHKSKHYYVMYTGITQGVKMGFRFPPIIMSILFFENAVDKLRGRQDFLSTVIGSLSTAGLFSLKNRFNLPTTAHVARIGLVGGLALGLIQDLHALERGHCLDYVEYLKGISGKIRGDAAMG